MLTNVLCLTASALIAIQPPSRVKPGKAPANKNGETPARRLVLSVGQTIPLQLSTKQPIRTALNENDKVARLETTPNDPTTVLVTGVAPGRTRITLIGTDGKKEVCTIGGPAKGP